MPRTLSADTIAALESGQCKFIVLVKIESPTLTLRMTSSPVDTYFITTGAWIDSKIWDDDDVWYDAGGAEVYLPGTLGKISPVGESTDISDAGISLTFSGVDVTTLSVSAAPDFINSPVSVVLLISSDVSATAGSFILFEGFVTNSPSISYGANSTVVVSCQGKFAALDRERSERYSDQEQQRKHPGDLGLQYATTVSSKEVIWPSASWFRNNS